jgi:hypothetical protein
VIEYDAPISHRRQHAGNAVYMVGTELLRFLEELARASPVSRDPYLGRVSPHLRATVRAALHLSRAEVLRAGGDSRGALRERDQYERRLAR